MALAAIAFSMLKIISDIFMKWPQIRIGSYVYKIKTDHACCIFIPLFRLLSYLVHD